MEIRETCKIEGYVVIEQRDWSSCQKNQLRLQKFENNTPKLLKELSDWRSLAQERKGQLLVLQPCERERQGLLLANQKLQLKLEDKDIPQRGNWFGGGVMASSLVILTVGLLQKDKTLVGMGVGGVLLGLGIAISW